MQAYTRRPMPPERHPSPPPRPPRDRHTGPGFGGGPRRSFGGGGFAGGGGPRDGGPRPPFTPRPPQPPAEPPQSVRLREGDREVEIHGNPAFVRQTLDDLPALFARLRGEAAPAARPASISLPRPPRADPEPEDLDPDFDDPEPEPPGRPHRERHGAKVAANGKGSLEDRVFSALEHASHPLSVAAIRKQIGGDTTGQQIRRILERASDRVVATSERPAGYTLR
jgi:hypothetical protein